ncbi:16357_t:CDS:2 [Racocetra fulgida]|uniref:16357_t:CDS:1 n=1 Tax=Racocetra fulgida TaxID=60492 RepID=A0A9N9FLL8_9GLOM|nr:16357_t:CDS:2 [Racocetra fulgida]
MLPTIVQAGHRLKDIWIKQIGNKKEERITVTELIPKTTLDIIGLVAQAYDSIINNNPSPLYVALLNYFPLIGNFPTSYNKKQYDSINIINNTSERLIAEQRSSLVRGKDLLSLLVKANENLPVDEQLTHNELIGQDRLRKEVLEILIDRDHYPTFDEIEHMKYLECVFKETLRIIPPGINTSLWIPIYAIHRNPLIWGEDAEHFNPSRWLDPEIKSKITNNTFLPFGAGPKNCLGMKMAHLEIKSILSILIRNFEFRLVEGFAVKNKSAGLSKPVSGIDLLVSKVDF